MASFYSEASTSLTSGQELSQTFLELPEPHASAQKPLLLSEHVKLQFSRAYCYVRKNGKKVFYQVNDNLPWTSRETFQEQLRGKVDQFWTRNPLLVVCGRSTRGTAYVLEIKIDLDQNPAIHNLSPLEMRQEILNLVKYFGLPEPNEFLESGTGLWPIWWTDPILPAQFKDYEKVAKGICARLAHLGADFSCTDPSRYSRVPGSINSKNGATVKLEHRHNRVHKLSDFNKFLEKAPVRSNVLKRLEAQSKKSGPKRQRHANKLKAPKKGQRQWEPLYSLEEATKKFEVLTSRIASQNFDLSVDELPKFDELWLLEDTSHYDFIQRAAFCTTWLEHLLYLVCHRKANKTLRLRELTAFHYRNFLVLMGKKKRVCNRLVRKFVKSFTKDRCEIEEFCKKSKSCHDYKSREFENLHGENARGYLYTTKKIIEDLNITQEEMDAIPGFGLTIQQLIWGLTKRSPVVSRVEISYQRDMKVLHLYNLLHELPGLTNRQYAEIMETKVGNISGWKKAARSEEWISMMVKAGKIDPLELSVLETPKTEVENNEIIQQNEAVESTFTEQMNDLYSVAQTSGVENSSDVEKEIRSGSDQGFRSEVGFSGSSRRGLRLVVSSEISAWRQEKALKSLREHCDKVFPVFNGRTREEIHAERMRRGECRSLDFG